MIVTVHYQMYAPSTGRLISLSYEDIHCEDETELVRLSDDRVKFYTDKYRCKVIRNFVKYSEVKKPNVIYASELSTGFTSMGQMISGTISDGVNDGVNDGVKNEQDQKIKTTRKTNRKKQ